MKKLVTAITLAINVIVTINLEYPQLQIHQGQLRGRYLESRKGRTICAYTGIPYAKPPLQNLRFKSPLAAEPWNGTFDATYMHPVCPQSNVVTGDKNIIGDENCLFLNVYTPQLHLPMESTLPVMVFFHGGGFLLGSANYDVYGPETLLDEDIILITINYRLGALGFLSLGDEVIPGNNGLKDQNLALKWIKNNIMHFGGNPECVTVFGQSAGGASSHYHMISPLSKDLINGVIAQSGTAVSAWGLSLYNENQDNSRKLVKLLNCTSINSYKTVECLRNIDAYQFIRTVDDHLSQGTFGPMVPFKPVIEPDIDGAFLPQHPINLIKSGNIAKVPLMIGITTEDGAMISPSIFDKPHLVKELNDNFKTVVPTSLLYYNTAPDKDYVSEKIREFYFGNGDIDYSSRVELTNMYTDDMFLSAANEIVKLHLLYSNQSIYYYLFGYRGNLSHSVIFGDPTYDYGVCHGDDLFYLFPLSKMFPNRRTEADNVMSDILTKLWTNFARFGEPKSEMNSYEISKWTPVQTEHFEHFLIRNITNIMMKEKPYWKRHEFWTNLAINRYNVSNLQ